MKQIQATIEWISQIKDYAQQNPLIIIGGMTIGCLIWLVSTVDALKTVTGWVAAPWKKPPFEIQVAIVKHDIIHLSDRQGQAVGDVDYKVELQIKNISEARQAIREVKINGNTITAGISFQPMQKYTFELRPTDVAFGLDALEIKTVDGRVLKLGKKETQAVQREFIQRKLKVAAADKIFKKAMLQYEQEPLKKPSDLMIDIVRETDYYKKATASPSSSSTNLMLP